VDPVTNAGSRGCAQRRHGRARAFTLLEMLLVLVLMAILAGVVSISTRPDPHQALALQAQRVGLLMSLAADEARLRREPIDWEADLHSYRFVLESANDRATFSNDDLLRERPWDPPLTRLAIVDLSSGTARTLVNADAPPLRMPAAQEWVQPRWRLELGNDLASVAVEFDANGHAGIVQ
jgi:general secretion pathway protein H